MNRRWGLRVATILWALLCGCAATGPAAVRVHIGMKAGAIENGAVDEASGIAASRRNADVLWVHNDSGDDACVYALSVSGKHLGRYRLAGVRARDCEDLAIGPGPEDGVDYLYVGDIGDNFSMWPEIYVHRVPEPKVAAAQIPVDSVLGGVETITLRYSDGPRDAETLMVDPRTQDLYVATKRDLRSRFYRAPGGRDTTRTRVLEFIGELPWGLATAGDITPDGSAVIIRNYLTAGIWRRSADTLAGILDGPVEHVLLTWEPQGEAIAFDATGAGYYTTSEGYSSSIYHYARPGAGPQKKAVIFRDDFESCRGSNALPATGNGVPKGWYVAGPAVTRSEQLPGGTDNMAMSITYRDAGDGSPVVIRHSETVSQTDANSLVAVEGRIGFDSVLSFSMQSGVASAAGRVRHDRTSATWQYEQAGGAWRAFSMPKTYGGGETFHFFRLVLDFENAVYVCFQFDRDTWYFNDKLVITNDARPTEAQHMLQIELAGAGNAQPQDAAIVIDDVEAATVILTP